MERTGVAAQTPEREGEGDIGAQVRLLRRIFQITPVPGLIFDSYGHLYPCRLRSAGPVTDGLIGRDATCADRSIECWIRAEMNCVRLSAGSGPAKVLARFLRERVGSRAMKKAVTSRAPRPPSLDDKLRELPPEKLAEVEDFVDFLRQKNEDEKLRRAALKMSEPSFRRVWDNPIDAAYDKL